MKSRFIKNFFCT